MAPDPATPPRPDHAPGSPGTAATQPPQPAPAGPPGLARRHRLALAVLGVALVAALVALWFWRRELWDLGGRLYELLQDREAFRRRIQSYGPWAPLVFIGVQFLQVVFSPIPGEVTGAVGGFVFGFWRSLLYSTIGLSLGSTCNFFVARLLGRSLIERVIPPSYLSRVHFIMERQGVIASLIFFTIPGMPKDYFCFLLGLTPMSWRIFLVLATLGRVPGTLLLSLQGSLFYQGNYQGFIWLVVLAVAMVIPVVLFRERIYQLLYRLDRKTHGPLD